MERQWNRALIVSLIMILSSMAGCLDADDDIAEPLPGDNIEDTNTNNTTSNDVVEIQPFGNVMVSTYHVGELVSAVAGEYVTMEYMSQSNIPVHDYDPTVEDIVRLQNSDLFFYHGLNLEPWVDSTLSSLGENAPPSFMTHAMPTGGITLDYESMLISDLCEHLSEGPYENTTLGIDDDGMLPEIHAEHNAHSFSFPVIDDDHDDHNETDDHDDHDDHNETDDHDDHDGHNHAEAEKIIENPEACPTNTVISIFHLEEGEHTIEFISEEGVSFNMVALKMNGGHAHDHHEHDGHNETDDHKENEMICYNINSHQIDEQYTNQTDCETAGLMWTERSSGPGDHDDHDDHEGVCHNTTTHENYESNESDCEAAGHVWMEDDEHDEHEGVCHNTTTHENYESNESDCEAAGHVWMEDDDHDDHDDHDEPTPQEIIDSFDSNNDSKLSWDEFWLHIEEDEHDDHDDHNETDDHDEHEEEEALMELFNASDNDGDGLLDLTELDYFIHALEEHDEHEGVCHNTTTHENYESNESDCEAAGHVWMEDDEHDEHDEHDDPTPQEIMDSFDSNNDSKLSWDEFWVAWSEDEHDGHDDHNETDDHDEHAVGYVSIHIEAEGDYGFALPIDVEFYILSEDSHEGHDHHGHDEDGHDEDGHDEDGHDEDSTIDAGDDESFMYDPHSWLDPVAFAAQVDVVLEKLILTFPNGTSNFTENANSYKVQLQDLDDKYEAAFGDAGACFVGGHEKTIVANHNAYSYISARYDIEIITLHGLDPEGEPSPEDIIGVINHIAENNITVLFIEEFTSQTAVNSIVEDTGVAVNTLYTMEMAPSNNDDNYMTMMNKNLNNIVNGIGC